MASPQKENGHTGIANEILEQIMKSKFNGSQFRILLCVLRQTYGYQRKEHSLSVGFISKATKIAVRQVQRELTTLIDLKVITIVQDTDNHNSRIISFNKNYDQWFSDDGLVTSDRLDTTDGLVTTTGDGLVISSSDGLVTQINKKESIKDTTTTENGMIQILNSYCEIHNKIDLHIKPSERTAMQLLSNSDIPLEFILESMKALHNKKMQDGDKVTSFLYYPNAITDAWKRRTTVVDFKPKKVSEEEIFRKFLEGS